MSQPWKRQTLRMNPSCKVIKIVEFEDESELMEKYLWKRSQNFYIFKETKYGKHI